MFRLFCLTCLIVSSLSAPAQALRPRAERLSGPVYGEVLNVLDGDTLSVRVHVWIGQQLTTDVRIAGIDTPELRGHCNAEREKAQRARQVLRDLLANKRVILSDIKLEKYAGRVLATVTATNGTIAGDHLIKSGLARPYAGAKRMGWCDSAEK